MPGPKIQVIKAVRAATGAGLVEAQEMVDFAPAIVASNWDEGRAAAFRRALEAAGARVNAYVS